jgi:hypothetical protein
MSYNLGSKLTLRGTFSLDDDPADPTTVTLWIKSPRDVVTRYAGDALTHQSTGVYELTRTFDEAGYWYFAFHGSGAVVARSAETQFQIVGSEDMH